MPMTLPYVSTTRIEASVASTTVREPGSPLALSATKREACVADGTAAVLSKQRSPHSGLGDDAICQSQRHDDAREQKVDGPDDLADVNIHDIISQVGIGNNAPGYVRSDEEVPSNAGQSASNQVATNGNTAATMLSDRVSEELPVVDGIASRTQQANSISTAASHTVLPRQAELSEDANVRTPDVPFGKSVLQSPTPIADSVVQESVDEMQQSFCLVSGVASDASWVFSAVNATTPAPALTGVPAHAVAEDEDWEDVSSSDGSQP